MKFYEPDLLMLALKHLSKVYLIALDFFGDRTRNKDERWGRLYRSVHFVPPEIDALARELAEESE